MDDQPSPPRGQRFCPSCGSPVEPGHKLCDICGTMVEELPTCRKCGTRFLAPVKFCVVCGTPLTPQENPQGVLTGSSAPQSAPPAGLPVTRTLPAQLSSTSGVSGAVPGKKPSPLIGPSPGPAKAPVNKKLIMGGIIVLLMVMAVVFFIGLPMIQSGSTGYDPLMVPVTTADVQTLAPAVVQTPLPTAVSTAVPMTPVNSLVPLPTLKPPRNQEVFFQVQKNQVNTGITVLFEGGPGSNSLSSAEVRVTHPDGTMVTGTIKPSKGVTEIILDGSKETDRVEVIVKMYDGQTYRVVDELLLYKAR